MKKVQEADAEQAERLLLSVLMVLEIERQPPHLDGLQVARLGKKQGVLGRLGSGKPSQKSQKRSNRFNFLY